MAFHKDHAAHPAGGWASGDCTRWLICPVCGGDLGLVGRALRCGRRHTFDIARERFVDLLPAGHGRSNRTGDAPEMIGARRRVFDRGYFAPLSDVINELAWNYRSVRDIANSPAAFTMLDAGCGEGYYTARLARSLREGGAGRRYCVFGTDISRAAVRTAARRYADLLLFINDIHHRISLADASVDLMLNIFAPRNPVEFARVIRPGGMLIVVIPTTRHLRELRARLPLIGIEPDKPERIVGRLRDGFSLIADEHLQYGVEMPAGDIPDLLKMTPNFRHLDRSDWSAADGIETTEITFGFTILCFRRERAVR